MDDANPLPNDVTQCHQFLLAAYKQSVELEQQAAEAKRHATKAEQLVAQSEQQVAELGRVLDETATSYQQLQQEHAATLDELAWYKRWTFGRKRERFAEGEGQGHLFDLDLPATHSSDGELSFAPSGTTQSDKNLALNSDSADASETPHWSPEADAEFPSGQDSTQDEETDLLWTDDSNFSGLQSQHEPPTAVAAVAELDDFFVSISDRDDATDWLSVG